VVRQLRDAGRPVRRDRGDRAEVLRGAACATGARRGNIARAARPRRRAGAAPALRLGVPVADARRVVRGLRRIGCLLRAGAHILRGAGAPA
jgi:hypothetical protein